MPHRTIQMRPFIKLSLTVCLLVLLVAWGHSMSDARAPSLPKSSTPEEHQAWLINQFLPWMDRTGETYSSVPRADGELLRELVVKTKRHHSLEIGSGKGYSSIWIGAGMEKTGGRLVTIEINPNRAAACRRNVKAAGLEKTVSCVRGNALRIIPRLRGRFDFLFVDVGPMNILPLIRAAEPKFTNGPIIAMHAVEFAKSYVKFLKYARTKGWFVGAVKPKGGMGLVLVSPKPLHVEGLTIKQLSF
ncbi:MAG: class I SAM-dependent methyltransferase [Deltaproteobacteria bacterium]